MAKKKSNEEEIRRGLEQLQGLGVTVDKPSPSLVPKLSDHVGKGRETDLAVIFLLGRIVDPPSLEALNNLEKTATDKEIKKEIRRSVFKLSQKGISAPLSKTVEDLAQRRDFNMGPEIEGYLSSVDGAGGRLVWLVKPQMGSGIQWLRGMISDREGLMQVGGNRVRRKELRHMAREIKENHSVTMISVPWSYIDQVLYEGYEMAKGLGRSGIEEFTTLRTVYNSSKPTPLPHPIYNRLSSEGIRTGNWRELSKKLLEEAEFRPWVLDEDWMNPHLERLQEAQESRLVLNEFQKEERSATIVRETVKSLFSEEIGRLFQRRMEDMALYFLETNREEQAKLALAVALQLGDEDLGGLDISFLTGLIQKSLGFYTAQTKSEPEESSLIVKP
ncbi:MAG: hypothetical protein V3U06_12885 [Candidatus Binatia bacterium]